MLLTKLSLARNKLIFPGYIEFGKWHSGWGRETANLFLQCIPKFETFFPIILFSVKYSINQKLIQGDAVIFNGYL
jgi:hypothetical protein